MKLLCAFLILSGSLSAQTDSAGYFTLESKKLFFELFLNPSNNAVLKKLLLGYPGFNGKDSRRARAAGASQASAATTGSATFLYYPLYPVVPPLFSYYAGGETSYSPLSRPESAGAVSPDLTTVPPVTPPDPQMIFVDEQGAGLLEVDLTTLTAMNPVALPPDVTNFAIRPSATGPAKEVWTVSYPAGISIVDLATGTVTATIPVALLNQNNVNTVPSNQTTGFTNDGATFFYALPYITPDSAGNNGALLVFDAATRTLTSTLLQKAAPAVLTMAPDGLTAYLLSGTGNGNITYYDVLSGTADLSAQLYTPGVDFSFNGIGPVFSHPDGTRLFWNAPFLAANNAPGGGEIQVFDLKTRQTSNSFTYSLPIGTNPVTFQMSQDGATFTVTYSGFGAVPGGMVVMDSLSGNVLATSQFSEMPLVVFPGPSVAP
jgi:hypothetical protein